jgi:hypothetical protein
MGVSLQRIIGGDNPFLGKEPKAEGGPRRYGTTRIEAGAGRNQTGDGVLRPRGVGEKSVEKSGDEKLRSRLLDYLRGELIVLLVMRSSVWLAWLSDPGHIVNS